MNYLEKRHVSRKANMQNVRYLDSFMDETDREVMNLTDRAFRSLCIGAEAIYNDSGLSPSPVSCHKPLAEDIPKKTQENSALAVKKHGSHPLNGVNDTTWQINKNSKVSSFFTAFSVEKNGDGTKTKNGESWDKSALLRIQRELSEFSSDYQSKIADGSFSQVKNQSKSLEKETKKSSKDAASGKSIKNKNSKLSKNSKNFFLHSEFSPFQSFQDLNNISLELRNMDIFTNKGPPEWYDSTLYKELSTSDRSHVSESFNGQKCQNASPPVPQCQNKLESSQNTAKTLNTAPLKPEKQLEKLNQFEIHSKAQLQQPLLTSSGSEQRCQSEGDPCAPWRKNRSRAKSAVPASLPLISSHVCDKSKPGEDIAQFNKKEVRTMEGQNSSSSTPFSISQLLTPVIPSRQGTGNSEILQAVLSPTTLDLPALPDTEMRPSPEIKREGYKSIASSLLFNLKDNRKRVKTMYSPPKFKALESADQSKQPIEQADTKNVLEVPEISDAKTKSPLRHKAHISQMSPLIETADVHSSPPGHINGGLPDDYLALSLLQPTHKSNQSPVVKASYPSLHLYRKASPVEYDTKLTHTLGSLGSVSTTDKVGKQGASQSYVQEKDGTEPQRKHIVTPALHVNKPTDNINMENTLTNHTDTKRTGGERRPETTDSVALQEKHTLAVSKMYVTKEDAQTILGSKNQDKVKVGGTEKVEKRSSKEKEPKPKHLFSSKQNNYIKNQRNVSDVDCGDVDCEYGGEMVATAGEEVLKGHKDDVLSRNPESKNEIKEKSVWNTNIHEEFVVAKHIRNSAKTLNPAAKDMVPSMDYLGASIEKEVKNNAISMKGNTSAKRALFVSKGEMSNGTVISPKKENMVMDKYQLAKAALEEVIAEREKRKKQALFSSDTDDVERCKKQKEAQDEVKKGDYKHVNMLGSGQRDTPEGVTKDKRGQKGILDFKPSTSEMETEHGDGNVAEAKLPGPPKQNSAVEHSQHGAAEMKYPKRDRSGRQDKSDTDRLKPTDKEAKLEPVAENTSLNKKSLTVANADKKPNGKSSDKSTFQKKSSSSKPEVPPRRGGTNSQCEELVSDKERQQDIERRADLGKTEDLISGEEKAEIPCIRKERGPVRGHVSALKEKFDREHGDGPKGSTEKDKMNQVVTVPKVTVNAFGDEKHNPEKMGMDFGNKELQAEDSNPAVKNQERSGGECADAQHIRTNINNNVTAIKEDKKDTCKMEKESSSDVLRETNDHENKSKGQNKRPVEELLSGIFGYSDGEKANPGNTSNKEITKYKPTNSEALQTDKGLQDSVAAYDSLKKHDSSSPVNFKHFNQSNLLSNLSDETNILHKTEESHTQNDSNLSSQARKCKENLEQNTQNSSLSNPDSQPCTSDRVMSPPSDAEKGGWVHGLIESASSLTPTCQSNVSSPTMGKLSLFNVKDNKFSTAPVTKTVRPILHKTAPDPWSPRESLSGSERGEGDLDLFKDCVEVQSPTMLSPVLPSTPITSPNLTKSPIHQLSNTASQLTTDREKKGQLDSLAVPEEDEWQSAVSSVSEGIKSCETSVGDTAEETPLSSAPTEDTEESKASSERSGSVCSGNEPQNKPPAVPPKTEKALRRAMQLTTRRNQKAEAKVKSERKGRSSEKSAKHKPERRQESTDKMLTNTSEHQAQSVERSSSSHSTGDLSSDRVLKTQYSAKHARQHKSQEGHKKDASKKLQLESHDGETKNSTETQREDKFEHNDQFDIRNVNVQRERLGRECQKHLLKKLDRRAQSLDRFPGERHEHKLLNTESQLTTVKKAPLRQNSIEDTYASTASNIVTQSFPMTQRKLLQDLDSGHYFVVDMPVQVKTKTFFDPETGSYVQLPVQSSDTSVSQAQSMEVLTAPSLVLYHGFVPLPVSSLPAQKPVKAGSIVRRESLEVCESNELKTQEERKREAESYLEHTTHVSHEHLQKEKTDIFR